MSAKNATPEGGSSALSLKERMAQARMVSGVKKSAGAPSAGPAPAILSAPIAGPSVGSSPSFRARYSLASPSSEQSRGNLSTSVAQQLLPLRPAPAAEKKTFLDRYGRAAQASAPILAPAPAPAANVLSSIAPAAYSAGRRTILPRQGEPSRDAPASDARRSPPEIATVNVQGKIIRVLFGPDAKGGKVGLLLEGPDGKQFKLQGTLTCPAQPGRRVTAKARTEEHPKYGPQFVAEIIIERIPVDEEGALGFLVNRLGLRSAQASKLYSELGEAVYEVIQSDPKRISSLLKTDAANIEAMQRVLRDELLTNGVWDFLDSHGISGLVASRIFSRFGKQTVDVAKSRPYELAGVEGVGFELMDKIAASQGIKADSSQRVLGAIEHALGLAGRQGHMASPVAGLVADVRAKLGSASNEPSTISSVLQALQDQGRLVRRVVDGTECLALATDVEVERSIATSVKTLMDAQDSDETLVKKARIAAKHLKDVDQENAVANVFSAGVSVITGRPGCGKSTVTKVIKDVARAEGLRVVMCAPTGMAASRMEEASGQTAQTVHSTLGYNLEEDGGGFTHTADNPLSGDIFLLDESSLADASLACAYLSAIPRGARVVFIGDVDQLPSVGPGAILRDLIESGKVPVARLQTIHRTAMDSDIVVNAHKIINGDFAGLNLKGQKDFRFREASEDSLLRKEVVSWYLEMVERYGPNNVMVMAPQRTTSVGVAALNELLRPIMNPTAPDKPEIEAGQGTLRLGDRVMRTSNNKRLKVANGQVGIITAVDPKSKKITASFGGRGVEHAGKELLALDHAYAATPHKMQGSESAAVLTVVSQSHRGMLDRSILYTAMTRGKKQSDFVGDLAAIRNAVARPSVRRWTGLADEIRIAFGDVISVPANGSKPTSLASLPQKTALQANSSSSQTRPSLVRRLRA